MSDSSTPAPGGDGGGDGIDRRGFLECMAWAGTGLLWTIGGGLARSRAFGQEGTRAREAGFTFAQISDSHIGFGKEPYRKTVTATLRETVAKINALPRRPDFLIHTGDLTHLSTAQEFDAVDQILREAKVGRIFYVPGEHDVIPDSAEYLKRFGKETAGDGWYSFDHGGVHFVGLVNVAGSEKTLGTLGAEQLDWLARDLAGRRASTPIVVFAHVPLWSVYPEWGWGTEDGLRAIELLRRFGSVTVLNGHVHQTLQKVEGNMMFHTARSTAFPQPAPGSAPSPGPRKDVPAEKLRSLLGLTSVTYREERSPLAIVDSSLG
ncbi:cyclic 3',5'-adenosine monophosphate phosphodiesterase [Aquisphaera giovannonii]|uniref:Cyclic 3',5'-adenosine monophosphate phosphodiesterase n=1 Tax=Aquisphaera giovannonii TaxID=406548 RepID=A0A5B9VZM9_9BACT|nr:metallophosphoesterase [Aquisphaera giovannonii]QEH33404.1 cyclic 3',5'-adenosine monophosphate phosphodiesterase [Aquisphaera giovannonii]